MKCKICSKEINNFFLHLHESSDEKHVSYMRSLFDTVKNRALNCYAFEIAEKYIYDLDGASVDIFTAFISNLIPLAGFSIRKRVGAPRPSSTEPVYDVTDEQIREALLKAIPHKFKRSTYLAKKTPCDYCGAPWDACKQIDTSVQPYVPSNEVSVCSDCKNTRNGEKVAITKIFYFAAAHHLPGHPRLCQFTHGHEWKLEVTVKDYIDPETRMVIDFSNLKKFVNKNIVDRLDHNYVNDAIWNPTAENICYWIWNELMNAGLIGIDKIKLWEAPDSFAELTLAEFNEV